MYHIPNDKRAYRSAERLCDALLQCLKKKDLKAISISDLHHVCYVSRATFYRLFDSVDDVVIYQCDRLFDGLAEELSGKPELTLKDLSILMIRRWLAVPELMDAIVKHHLIGALIQAHERNDSILYTALGARLPKDPAARDYLMCTLSGLLPIMVEAWQRGGRKDSPEEIYEHMKQSVDLIHQLL